MQPSASALCMLAYVCSKGGQMSDRSPNLHGRQLHAHRERACSDAAVEPVTDLPCIRPWINRGAAVHAVCGHQGPVPLSMPHRVLWSQSSQVWPRTSILLRVLTLLPPRSGLPTVVGPWQTCTVKTCLLEPPHRALIPFKGR
ncbi:hypothetical protein B0T18DRAFT_144926 [Schizothecium vesticola]|uniref:Uncharacterized protein n=1 Tax=Schizothecium vesticola TaxID=314040 RepID=A0AA40K506_9PEZI|nr:hypothetical protein B0T18DRAFT_144926 [Schizothecium vesticola]